VAAAEAGVALSASDSIDVTVSVGAGAVLLDQHDDWAIAERRYLSEEPMAAINNPPDEITTALPAA
jgi:hypothetical protein